MDRSNKRSEALSPGEVQRGSSLWWSRNPMSYDWNGEVAGTRFSREWFDAIDARFLDGSRLFATLQRPFDQILPIEELRGLGS